MLTRKQHELLIFIDKHLRDTGFSPSFEEMKEALSLKSKSGIHRLITALEERGFLKRRAHRARALEVIRLPESMAPRRAAAAPAAPPSAPVAAFAANVIRGNFAANLPGVQKPANEAAAVHLPLYGRIAAGATPANFSSSPLILPMPSVTRAWASCTFFRANANAGAVLPLSYSLNAS